MYIYMYKDPVYMGPYTRALYRGPICSPPNSGRHNMVEQSPKLAAILFRTSATPSIWMTNTTLLNSCVHLYKYIYIYIRVL